MADEYLGVLLTQLMENAVIHNPDHGKTVWVGLADTDGSYELSVADNGHGIPDDKKSGLFDSRRRYGGIGLHLAHHIVNRYGGRITVMNRIEGDPSQGADFRVSLPRIREHGPASGEGPFVY
jgi:two-component system sensor histidine kinase SenX3